MRAWICTAAPPGWRVSVVTRRAFSAGTARCSEAVELRIRKHLCCSGFHQCRQVGRLHAARTPRRAGHPASPRGCRASAPSRRRRSARSASAPCGGTGSAGCSRSPPGPARRREEKSADVEVVPQHEQLRHRQGHRFDDRPACGPASGSVARPAIPRQRWSDRSASARPGWARAPRTWCSRCRRRCGRRG